MMTKSDSWMAAGHHLTTASACALTIACDDDVHRGVEKIDVVLDRKKYPEITQIRLPKRGTEITPLLLGTSNRPVLYLLLRFA